MTSAIEISHLALVETLMKALQGVGHAPTLTVSLPRFLGRPESPGDPTIDEWFFFFFLRLIVELFLDVTLQVMQPDFACCSVQHHQVSFTTVQRTLALCPLPNSTNSTNSNWSSWSNWSNWCNWSNWSDWSDWSDLSNRSNRSNRTNRSNRSNRTNRSNRSNRTKSDQSVQSVQSVVQSVRL